MHSPRKKKVKPLSRAAIRKHLKPYAAEIGQASLAWNYLHENLRVLFWFVLGQSGVPIAIWEKLSNDRLQRDILNTAVKAGAFEKKDKRLTDDVLWLLKKTGKLADRRNNAVHAPLTTLTGTISGITTVEPIHWFGNKRAKGLVGKDIVWEIEWCAEWAHSLSVFASALFLCMNPSDRPWPERPSPPSHPPHSNPG